MYCCWYADTLIRRYYSDTLHIYIICMYHLRLFYFALSYAVYCCMSMQQHVCITSYIYRVLSYLDHGVESGGDDLRHSRAAGSKEARHVLVCVRVGRTPPLLPVLLLDTDQLCQQERATNTQQAACIASSSVATTYFLGVFSPKQM